MRDTFLFCLFLLHRGKYVSPVLLTCTNSGGCLFTRDFSLALCCYSASSQSIAAHICCGDHSAPLVHGNASCPSSLSSITHAFHFTQSHLINSSFNLAPENVQKIFLLCSSPAPPPIPLPCFLGILANNFVFKICGG